MIESAKKKSISKGGKSMEELKRMYEICKKDQHALAHRCYLRKLECKDCLLKTGYHDDPKQIYTCANVHLDDFLEALERSGALELEEI